MNKSIIQRAFKLTEQLKNKPIGKSRHYSFLIKQNRIINVGYNNSWKTHPLSKKMHFRFGNIHAEFSCLIKYRNYIDSIKDCSMLNIRINNNKQIDFSKPCKFCQKLIKMFGIKKCYYTNHIGQIEYLYL